MKSYKKLDTFLTACNIAFIFLWTNYFIKGNCVLGLSETISKIIYVVYILSNFYFVYDYIKRYYVDNDEINENNEDEV